MAKKVKLALIDSHGLIHRAFHALPPMNTKDGTPTNAVYGFTTMLLKMFSTLKPTHVVAAFDVKGPTFRKEKFAAYKAHRKPLDPNLLPQFDLVRDVVRAFGIPIIEKQGFEADDVIGTLAAQINGEVQKIIVTGDQDTLQLVDDHTFVFTLKRGITDTILYDAGQVRQQYGFGPERMTDYKGLRGDPSDNIPGVKGVGEKTAKDAIMQFGSIENIYKHLADLPPRAQRLLEGKKEEALFSRELATIRRDVPVEFTLEDARLAGYDTQKVRDVFTRFQFRSLLTRLPNGGTAAQPTLFAAQEKELQDSTEGTLPENYHLVESEKDQRALIARLSKEKLVAFDTENEGLGARAHPIVGMSFAIRTKKGKAGEAKGVEAWYVPVTRETVKAWKGFFENPAVGKTGHNLKYDAQVLRQSGLILQGVVFDSMIASYLLNPGARQYGLDALAIQELNYHPIPLSHLLGDPTSPTPHRQTTRGAGLRGAQREEQKKISEVPLMDLARYAAEDAEVAWRLYEVFLPRIKEEDLLSVLVDIEMPLIHVLAVLESNGIAVDPAVLKKLGKGVTVRIAALQKKIWGIAGREFNVNSTQQLRVLLFETLRLPTVAIKKTQTGFSTASSELEKLRGLHPVIELLEEYRELTKLNNTYIKTLPDLVEKETGRIYSSFNQTIAATGRLSSIDPNLQNIPVRTELGQEIRAAFVADWGNRLVKADYSQVELRLAAHLSQDSKMIEVFRAGQDIHAATAAWVYGIDPKKVTPGQRREAKTLNFGVLYGMGPNSFARAAGISVEEARAFIGRYREQYKGLTKYIEATVAHARREGYVVTLFGRKRYVPEIHSNNPAMSAQAERIAFNFPLQGTAADILKKAMIELQQVIEKDFPSVRMVLTVHDELVCEVPAGEVEEFAKRMRKAMEAVITLDVPLVVDVSAGKNWRDMKGIA